MKVLVFLLLLAVPAHAQTGWDDITTYQDLKRAKRLQRIELEMWRLWDMAKAKQEKTLIPDPAAVQERIDQLLAKLKIARRLLRLAEEQKELASKFNEQEPEPEAPF